MSQRRKIAIAYLLAVPAVLLVVLLLHNSLFRVNASEDQITRAAGVLSRSETAVAQLEQAQEEGYQYAATGKDIHLKAYEAAASQIPVVLGELHRFAGSPREVQMKAAALESLVSARAQVLDKAVKVRMVHGSGAHYPGALPEADPKVTGEITRAMTEITAAVQPLLEQQRQSAQTDIRFANLAATYGGGVVIWLVGLAAFLLFHDEKARAWAGIERRVHTKILDTFPLGVALTTTDGVILYANRAEESQLGYRPGELIGRNILGLVAEDESAATPGVDRILDRLGAHEVWSGEMPLRKSDDSTVRAASWMMGLEMTGKSFRVVVHSACGAETVENPDDSELTARWRATFQNQ